MLKLKNYDGAASREGCGGTPRGVSI